MRKLYHQTLCPFSRKVRVFLKEAQLDAQLVLEKPWLQREEFFQLNPAGQVPVLEEIGGLSICDSSVICEYIDEIYQGPSFFGKDIFVRVEARRLQVWFDEKFHQDVTDKLVFEKTIKQQKRLGGPDSNIIRVGFKNLHLHLEYMEWLLERRNWLAGELFTVADMAAGAHISCLDYLNQMPWDKFELVKEWYSKLKSRPSFRPLLNDKYPAIDPPQHYKDLDF